MNSFPFMVLLLLVSSILCFLMNSWISIWVMLEVNTLAFCCLTKNLSMEKKASTEASMKYFIIQSISSSLLVFSMITFNVMNKLYGTFLFLGVLALMIKMGSSPFHQWFVTMVKSSKWWNSVFLMTWQKLAPVFLVLYQIKKYVYFFVCFSAVVGSLSQMNKTSLMEIMAFSSIFNLSWMLMAILMSSKLLILFSLVYWSSVVIVITVISKSKMEKVSSENIDNNKKWLYFVVAINLGGIPPMAGFLAKWLVFKEMLTFDMSFLVTLFLVTSSINLYIYLRFMNQTLAKTFLKKQKSVKDTKKVFTKMIILVNTFPLLMVALYSMRLKKGLFW